MKAHLILYTATAALDYRFVAKPYCSSIPDSVLSIFEKRILGLLSSEKAIEKPKWMLCKEVSETGSFILWGVACQNSSLSEVSSSDIKGRLIQCFIGLVITCNDTPSRLPFDMAAFKVLFNDVIDRKWKSFDSKSEDIHIEVDEMMSVSYLYPKEGSHLNFSQNTCRFFPPSMYSDESLLSEALASETTVSLATAIRRKSEVTEPEYEPLMNAVLLQFNDSIKDFPVKRICKKCKTAEYDLISGICPKCRERKEAPYNPKKNVCRECGMEKDYLTDGLCQECFDRLNKVSFKKYGRLLNPDQMHKNGKWLECHAKDMRKRKLSVLVLLILIALLSFKKCNQTKSPFGSHEWENAHVFEWFTKSNDK